jgi:hypothetical protein
MSSQPHEVELALLQKEMTDLREEMSKLSSEVAGLVRMWETASGVVAFVKWLAGIATAFGILWAAFRVKIGG